MRALVLAAALASVGFAPGARAAEPHELSVMAFNIWYGGVQVDFETVAKAIRAANPDVVAVQEPEGNLRRLAEAAGYGYVDESLHLMSRLPIYPGEQDGLRFGYIALDPLHVAAVAGLHLTSSPYGPEAVRDGSSVDEVLTLERETRLPEIEPYVAALGAVAAKGVPTIVLGDFNTPSHQDWTEAAVAAGKVKYAVDWPVTRALADAGFVDSYRAMHPDPVAVPGKTWTAGTPPPRVRPIETLDRIDMIWSSGPATAIASSVVGEAAAPTSTSASIPGHPTTAPSSPASPSRRRRRRHSSRSIARSSCRVSGSSPATSRPATTRPDRLRSCPERATNRRP